MRNVKRDVLDTNTFAEVNRKDVLVVLEVISREICGENAFLLSPKKDNPFDFYFPEIIKESDKFTILLEDGLFLTLILSKTGQGMNNPLKVWDVSARWDGHFVSSVRFMYWPRYNTRGISRTTPPTKEERGISRKENRQRFIYRKEMKIMEIKERIRKTKNRLKQVSGDKALAFFRAQKANTASLKEIERTSWTR